MPKKSTPLPKVQVIMDYKTLQQLLAAASEVETLRDDVKHLRQQLSALRFQFTELIELYRTYQD